MLDERLGKNVNLDNL